jgi:hypothetical protein
MITMLAAMMRSTRTPSRIPAHLNNPFMTKPSCISFAFPGTPYRRSPAVSTEEAYPDVRFA